MEGLSSFVLFCFIQSMQSIFEALKTQYHDSAVDPTEVFLHCSQSDLSLEYDFCRLHSPKKDVKLRLHNLDCRNLKQPCKKEGERSLCFATIIISFRGASYGFQGRESGALPVASHYTKHLIEAEREKGTEFSTCNMIGGSSKVRQLFCQAWVPKMDPCHVRRTKTIRSFLAMSKWNRDMWWMVGVTVHMASLTHPLQPFRKPHGADCKEVYRSLYSICIIHFPVKVRSGYWLQVQSLPLKFSR